MQKSNTPTNFPRRRRHSAFGFLPVCAHEECWYLGITTLLVMYYALYGLRTVIAMHINIFYFLHLLMWRTPGVCWQRAWLRQAKRRHCQVGKQALFPSCQLRRVDPLLFLWSA